jgi:AcrR family transcriptional regulator
MTLAAVGERAGYSRGLATSRFGSKDQLLNALVERLLGEWSHRNVFPLTKDRSGRESIYIGINAIADQVKRDPTELRVLYALVFEALSPVPDLHSRFVQLHEMMRTDLARIVRRGIRDGSIRKGIQAAEEASLIVSSARGIAYQWLLDPDGFDPVRTLRYLADTTDARLRPNA